MKKLLLILLCLPIIGFGQESDFFKDSYKEQLSTNKLNKNNSEYYDDKSKLYSNFKYSISYKETKGWIMDMGVSEHTILTAYQPDSGHTFTINVIEVDIPKEEQNMNSHKMLDQIGEQDYINLMKQNLSKQFGEYPSNFNLQKIYYKNFPAIKSTFEIRKRDRGEEWVDVHILIQVIRGPLNYTIGLITLDFLYEYDKNNLETVFDHINFLKLN